MDDFSPRQRLALLLRILGHQGYQDKITGHITVAEDDGETLLVNPVELFWTEVRARNILRINDAGQVLAGEGRLNPTSTFHFAIHRRRVDARVLVHNHPPYGTIWSAKGEVPPLLDQTGANGGGVAVLCSEYDGILGAGDKAEALADLYGDADMAILVNHGTLVSGDDEAVALVRALSFEWRCRKAYEVSCTGSKGVELPQPVADEIGSYAPSYGALLFEAYSRQELATDPSVLDE
jgi:ribulose-5-phosphate 4-epimerase/fuculose-1-phosphate aldolase